MNALVPQSSTTPALADLGDTVHRLLGESRSPGTKRTHGFAWRDFTTFTRSHNLNPLPASPETICLYVADLIRRGQKVATIQRKLAAVSVAHQVSGHEPPTRSALVRSALAGARRTLGVAPNVKEPLTVNDLRVMVTQLPNTLVGIRDRALLLVGFTGAFRRSELVGIRQNHLAYSSEGVSIRLLRSKTDPEGQGRIVGIPFTVHSETCPVRALQEWLEIAPVENDGYVFRPITRSGCILAQPLSTEGVARVVKRNAKRLGYDPARFAGVSLRAGLATAAARAGASSRSIQNQTGHRSEAMLRRYIRHGTVFVENPVKLLGL